MDEQELQDLIGRYYALGGQESNQAGEELYRHTRRRVWEYLFSLAGCRDLADDLTHQVFLAVVGTRAKGTARYDPSRGGVIPWLFRVARNEYIDYRRKRGEEPMGADAPAMQQLQSREPSPCVLAAGREEAARLHEAIGRLPPRQREAMHLRLEGFSLEEIATHLGVKPGTAGSTLDGAVRNLRQLLVPDPEHAATRTS
jgi:RNA polymerase sigma-70 factor (ECF subfamily)